MRNCQGIPALTRLGRKPGTQKQWTMTSQTMRARSLIFWSGISKSSQCSRWSLFLQYCYIYITILYMYCKEDMYIYIYIYLSSFHWRACVYLSSTCMYCKCDKYKFILFPIICVRIFKVTQVNPHLPFQKQTPHICMSKGMANASLWPNLKIWEGGREKTALINNYEKYQ